MKELLYNRLFMYVLIALIIAVLVYALFSLTAQSNDNTITVVRVKNNVGVNEVITENMLTEKTIGALGVGNAVITDKAEVIGKYTAIDIFPEDNLTAAKFSDSPTGIQVSKNQRLITISVSSAAAGGGGYVTAGSKVDVATYNKDTGESIIHLTNIKVYSVKNSALADVDDLLESTIPSFVTLVVTSEQAAQLVKMEYSEKLHLLLVE